MNLRKCLTAGLVGLWCFACGPAPRDPLGTGLSHLMIQKNVETKRVSSADPTGGNVDGWGNNPLMPRESRTLAELTGPGVVTHIWNTAAAEKDYLRTFVLRIYWDGQEHPSVESPLGDFFAEGHGVEVEFHSLPVSVSGNGRARNCYFPMPFRKFAKITITNEGDVASHAFYFYIDYVRLPVWNKDYRYFHARYSQAHPAPEGEDYVILETTGQGQYVGTVYNVQNTTLGWWGEGDDMFYIDGDSTPTLQGTGSEDYFNNAYGMRLTETPYYGSTISEGRAVGSRSTCYRWHIEDPIVFHSSLKVAIEHGFKSAANDRLDNVSSVAFWYQTLPSPRFPPLPPASERILEAPVPENREILRAWGFQSNGQYAEAIQAFKELLRKNPEEFGHVRTLALLYLGMPSNPRHEAQDPDKGLVYVERLLAKDPEDRMAHWLKAYAYILKIERGEIVPPDAIEILDRAAVSYGRSELVKTLIAKHRRFLIENKMPDPVPLL